MISFGLVSQAWKDLFEKLSERVLLFNQGCFSFNFKQFQGKLRDYIGKMTVWLVTCGFMTC